MNREMKKRAGTSRTSTFGPGRRGMTTRLRKLNFRSTCRCLSLSLHQDLTWKWAPLVMLELSVDIRVRESLEFLPAAKLMLQLPVGTLRVWKLQSVPALARPGPCMSCSDAIEATQGSSGFVRADASELRRLAPPTEWPPPRWPRSPRSPDFADLKTQSMWSGSSLTTPRDGVPGR
mmetsp:Transcript_98339/g.300704  ORF Transcript_98339/g.300704 Transcript_98339/m.300704 type:complete len:176 (+) Transcript_98339:509-1036(+)